MNDRLFRFIYVLWYGLLAVGVVAACYGILPNYLRGAVAGGAGAALLLQAYHGWKEMS